MSYIEPANKKDQILLGAINSLFPALTVFVMLLIGLIAYYILFLPQYSRTKTGGDLNVVAKKASLESYNLYLARLKNIQLDINEIQANPNAYKLDYALPDKVDLPALLTQMEAIVASHGIQLLRFDWYEMNETGSSDKVNQDALGLKPPPGAQKVRINLILGRMDYNAMKSLLFSLERNVRLFDVVAMSFDPQNNSQSIGMNTYFYK